MVRNYKRRTDRGGWSEDSMKKAIQDVLDGKKGYKLASKFYNVPQTTLERKVNLARRNDDQIQSIKVPLGPISTVFTEKEEQELVVYLKEMEGRLFGLTTSELQKLAYQLAIRNKKQHKFNNAKEQAGKDWLRGFLNRHPDLSLRKPENTSAARAAGFNKVSVGLFYELLGKTLDKHPFTPDKIYNCDETGVSVVPKSRSRVVAATGKKQVGALTSAERGTTITIEICFNAAGTYMPPMFIFPRKRMKRELLNGAPPNSWAECSDSGWITAEIFLKWFQKFVEFTNASKDNPIILLLDGHATHIQNLELIDEARKHGVTIICFPPHTTHKLQPGDVGFMRPLSVFYDQAVTAWLRSNPGQIVTQFQVAELFGQAFIRAATMATALNAFKACGISPFNAQIFTDADFVAAEATDIEQNREAEIHADKTPLKAVIPQQAATPPESSSLDIPTFECQNSTKNLSICILPPSTTIMDPSYSGTNCNTTSTTTTTSISSVSQLQPLQLENDSQTAMIQPLQQETSSKDGVPCKTAITSTPQACSTSEIDLDLDSNSPRPSTSKAIQASGNTMKDSTSFNLISPKQLMPYPRMTQKRKRQVRKRGKTAIITNSPYKLELEERQRSKKQPVKKIKQKSQKKKKPKRRTTKDNKESESEVEDTECLYCHELYSVSNEGWITCQACGQWAHCGCAGVEDNDYEAVHICPICEDSDE